MVRSYSSRVLDLHGKCLIGSAISTAREIEPGFKLVASFSTWQIHPINVGRFRQRFLIVYLVQSTLQKIGYLAMYPYTTVQVKASWRRSTA